MTEPPSRSRLANAFLLGVAVLAILTAAMAPRDLWAPDEPRYGQVAREVLRDGQWLVLHVNREPYAEKPPVWYWFAALLSLPQGDVTPISARLASAILAAGAVLLTARLGKRFFADAWLGTTAGLLFASMGLVVWNAPRAALDLPLTFFVLAAVDLTFTWWRNGRVLIAILAGVAWAAAVLVKGPVGFFLPPLVFLGGALAARKAPRITNAGWWLGPVVMAGLCLAWLLPAMQAGGEAYADRLLGQIGARVTGEKQGHVRWVGYYPTRVVVHLLPWALHGLAGLCVLAGWRNRPTEHRYGLGASLAGSVGLLLVLTLFATKREVYLLPALPFAALLAAYAIRFAIAPRIRAWGRLLLGLCLGAMGVASAAAPWAIGWVGARKEGLAGLSAPDTSTILTASLGGAGLLLAGVWVIENRARAGVVVRAGAIFVLLGAAFLHVAVIPLLDPAKSYRMVAAAAEQAAGEGEIHVAGWYRTANLLWCSDRTHIGEIRELDDALHRLRPSAPRTAVVFERGAWERWQEEPNGVPLAAARVAWRGRVGNRRLVVVTNR